jgi:3-methyladenine DNA glycosylase AlkD
MTTFASGQRPEEIVADLTEKLRADATQERAEKEKAYLKSDLDFLGASVPTIRRAAKAVHRQHPDLSRDDLVRLVEELWGRHIHELRMAAVELLDLYSDRLTPADLGLLERLVRESKTWALVDGLSASVVGSLVDRFPDELHDELARWARLDDFWVRRVRRRSRLAVARADLRRRRAGAPDTECHRAVCRVRHLPGGALRGVRRPAVHRPSCRGSRWLRARLRRDQHLDHPPQADRLTGTGGWGLIPEPRRRTRATGTAVARACCRRRRAARCRGLRAGSSPPTRS